MFILTLCRWYSALRPDETQQQQQQQEQMSSLAMTQEETDNEESQNRRPEFFLETSPLTTEDDFCSHPTVDRNVPKNFSNCATSWLTKVGECLDEEGKFPVDFNTTYESFNEVKESTCAAKEGKLEMHQGLDQSTEVWEETVGNDGVHKADNSFTGSVARKEKIIAEITSFLDTLDATTEHGSEHETMSHHEFIDTLDEGEFYLHDHICPSLSSPSSSGSYDPCIQASSSLPHFAECPPECHPSSRVLHSSLVLKSPSFPQCIPELLPTSCPSPHRYPFSISDGPCNSTNLRSRTGTPLGTHSSNFESPQSSGYAFCQASSVTSPDGDASSIFHGKQRLCNGSATKVSGDVVTQKTRIKAGMSGQRLLAGFKLFGRKSDPTNELRSKKDAVTADNREKFSSLRSGPSYTECIKHSSPESKFTSHSQNSATNLKPYIPDYQNLPGNHSCISKMAVLDLNLEEGPQEFKERIYDQALSNLRSKSKTSEREKRIYDRATANPNHDNKDPAYEGQFFAAPNLYSDDELTEFKETFYDLPDSVLNRDTGEVSCYYGIPLLDETVDKKMHSRLTVFCFINLSLLKVWKQDW
ncbi:unnamed protein product [Gongylonema pulchrum]|uniref:DUF4585 domain-containing protein n=1 Tax=Gongylonema pulchrum TaxID=637853 RepID=A0A183D2B3_9BILA|nr:unnamed protein product [Gongylonema pulchrum]